MSQICPWTATVWQEPGIHSHHGSAPHISVTESTPERNRRLLSVPANHLQVPTQQQHSSSIEVRTGCVPDTKSAWPVFCSGDEFDPCLLFPHQQAESLEQQDTFINLISHGQRGRMDDQRCSLDPSRSAPCTPNNTRKIDVNNAGEICFCLFFRRRLFWLVSRTFIFQFQVIWNLCLFSPPNVLWFNVQIRTSSSASWPTHRADGSMINECLFHRCLGYRRNRKHPLQGRIQATCVTWSLKYRLALFYRKYRWINTLRCFIFLFTCADWPLTHCS